MIHSGSKNDSKRLSQFCP